MKNLKQARVRDEVRLHKFYGGADKGHQPEEKDKDKNNDIEKEKEKLEEIKKKERMGVWQRKGKTPKELEESEVYCPNLLRKKTWT